MTDAIQTVKLDTKALLDKYKDDDSVLLIEDEDGIIVTKKFTDEDWKKVDEMIDNHPLFSKNPGNVEDNELLQALQAIKYDESAEQILEQLYKEANQLMKSKLVGQSDKKRFFLTKCMNVYADALAQEAQCIKTRARILSNRALLHLWVKNYRKCVEDCLEALKLEPTFVRPYARAAEALLGLGNYEKCIQMADKGLHIEFIKELKDVRDEAIKKYEEEQDKLKVKQTKKKEVNNEIISKCIENNFILGNPSDFPLPLIYNVGSDSCLEKIDRRG